jgi:sulfite reductase alpha subunit-like flavoprotein
MTASTSRVEEILVCYGTQTGNSEHAAQEFCRQVATKLSPPAIQSMTGTQETIAVQATLCQLDDFLELRQAQWTRLMVIFTSSYGIGQAPLGCRRFRELCEYWLVSENPKSASRLEGFRYALCGLGDSKYPTFFTNPTKIDQALQLMKAERVGPLGKADASGTGDQEDVQVIQDWTSGIWPYLAKVVRTFRPRRRPLPREGLSHSGRFWWLSWWLY